MKTIVCSLLIGFAASFCFGQDKSQVIFVKYVSGVKQLCVINTDGSDLTVLTTFTTDPPTLTNPSYSPDGSMVAFWLDTGTGINVWLMNADGTNQRQVTFNNEAYVGDRVEFSPTMDLLYYRRTTGPGAASIWQIGLNGENNGLFYDFPGNEYRIVFVGNEYLLYHVNFGGIYRTNSLTDLNSSLLVAGGEMPALNPDETKMSYRSGADKISIANVDGTSPILLADEGGGTATTVMYPMFTADNQYVVYHVNYQIKIVKTDGTGNSVLTSGWDPYVKMKKKFIVGNVEGAILDNTIGVGGIVIRLLDVDGIPVPSLDPVYSDPSGKYAFEGVIPSDYQVVIVEPLGYTVDQNPKPATVTAGATTTVDFSLTQVAICNDARGKGYWKHQFDVYVTGKGHAQETSADLTGFLATVHERYTPHFDLFAGKTLFVDWQGLLSPAKKASMLDKAKEHLAALVMNLVSLKIGQYTVVTADGRTAGDVLTYVSTLLSDADLSNDETAKDLAEAVNEQTTIAAGRVPVGSILYKGGVPPISWGTEVPRTFALHNSYPNPFNPTTLIEYEIAKGVQVSLTVWSSLGQEVARLVDAYQEPGRYRVGWDAGNFSSGVYFCRMNAGGFVSTNRLLLVR